MKAKNPFRVGSPEARRYDGVMRGFEAARQLQAKKGPYYEKWLAGTANYAKPKKDARKHSKNTRTSRRRPR